MIRAITIALVIGALSNYLPRRVVTALLAAGLAFILALMQVQGAEPPQAAQPYQRTLIREARAVGGLNAPVAMFAGQIEQESGWDPNAKSSYANGLAQFTPATAAWISGVYKSELGGGNAYNPEWAIRALIRYDTRIYEALSAATECDRWAFALSAYNGGPGWVSRDRSLCAAAGCQSARWFGQVENYTARSADAAKENRAYPRRILLVTQHRYVSWGRVVPCSVS